MNLATAHVLDSVHKFGRSGLGDPSEVVLELVLGHPHTRVFDDQGLGIL